MSASHRATDPPWTVLVLGATGYVGRHLVARMVDRVPGTNRGVRLVVGVRAAQRNTAQGWAGVAEVVPCDLLTPGSAARAIEATAPDVVVNCAAIPSVGVCEQEPATSLAVNCPEVELLRAVEGAAHAPRLVHLSTDLVMAEGRPGVHLTEKSPLAPGNAYAEHKARFEGLLAASSADTLVLRCSNIVGPPAPRELPVHTSGPPARKFTQWLAGRLLAGEAVACFSDEIRNFVAVTDVADAIIACLAPPDRGLEGHGPVHGGTAAPEHGLYLVGGPTPLNRVAIAAAVRENLACSLPPEKAAGLGAVTPVTRVSVSPNNSSPLQLPLDTRRLTTLLGRPLADPVDYLRRCEVCQPDDHC